MRRFFSSIASFRGSRRAPGATEIGGLWRGTLLALRLPVRRLACIAAIVILSSCGGLPSLDRSALEREPSAGAAEEEYGPMRVAAIDVGQGDATLVVAPTGEAALIDAGPWGVGASAVREALLSMGAASLDAMIVTHYHEDHFGGVPEVMALLSGKGAVYDRGEPVRDPESPRFPLYESSAAGRRLALRPGDTLRFGDVRLEAVAVGGLLPDGTQVDLGEPADENAASIAVLIRFGGFAMLVAGDITGGGGNAPHGTPDVETSLAPFVGDIDVLRVAHHGSNTSTNKTFLDAVRPEAAIISVGDGNDHFHPHSAVIERLLEAGAEIFQTERGWLSADGPSVADGDIVIEVSVDGRYEIM